MTSTTCPTDCPRTCFYCDASLSPRHEHDHWPTAKRHGGTDAVAICLNCHDLKDRVPLNDWPVELVAQAFAEAGPIGRLLIAKVAALYADMKAEQERAA